MEKIKIIKAESWNWYKENQIFEVKDWNKYEEIGVQIVKENNGQTADVVQHGHYEILSHNKREVKYVVHICALCDEPIDEENGDDITTYYNEYCHSTCVDADLENKQSK